MEGYLFDRDDAKKAFRRAAGVAHADGRKVSLTLSDSFCVDRHRDDFAALVRDEVDILFGNDDELCSLYEVDVARRRDRRGARASASWRRSPPARTARTSSPPTTSSQVPAEPVARVLDTTGAGDLYAAGFLTATRQALPLAECARLGSIAAAEVISHVGPRPLVELRTLLP